MTEDENLLRLYWKGWNDCSNGTDNSNFYSGIKLRTYNLGWSNYIVGDDVTSVDNWSNERILKLIKDDNNF